MKIAIKNVETGEIKSVPEENYKKALEGGRWSAVSEDDSAKVKEYWKAYGEKIVAKNPITMPENDPGILESLGVGIGQTLSMGFGDETMAKQEATPEQEKAVLALIREREKQIRKDHPVANAVGNVAGALPSVIVSPGASIPALLAMLGIQGGVGGLGNADKEGEFIGDTEDAAKGAAVGLLSAGAFNLGSSALNAALRGGKGLTRNVADVLGKTKVGKHLKEGMDLAAMEADESAKAAAMQLARKKAQDEASKLVTKGVGELTKKASDPVALAAGAYALHGWNIPLTVAAYVLKDKAGEWTGKPLSKAVEKILESAKKEVIKVGLSKEAIVVTPQILMQFISDEDQKVLEKELGSDDK